MRVCDSCHRRSCVTTSLLFFIVPSLVLATSTVPAPIVVAPSQYWEGNDGPWSSFTIQVGTPAQDVRVLISTAGTQTWVVLPQDCTTDAPSNCADLRGQEFSINASSTWSFNNYFDLELESNLGYVDSGEFGFDTVGLSWQGSGGPSLEHQVVAGIATSDFWLGTFGLTPRPTNFSNFNDPQSSFMETLKNKSLIPSLSWAYTAGAPYKLEKVFGSLVLGGYDLSKAGSTNMSFAFAPDISRDLTVGLQGISANLQGTNNELLPEGIFTFIDSTVPSIWLPIAACQQFEKVFGLTWDETTELYLVNDTLHTILMNNNASFTFSLGNSNKGGPVLNITLPYASFDLSVSYPIVANTTRYFPIMRAANDTQYTLGRAFLQEAYLTVDYERSQFYLSQCTFQQGATEHIITIPSANSTSNSSPSSHSLPVGAIVGIVFGCVLITVGLVLCLLFFTKYPPFAKKRIEEESERIDETHETEEYTGKPELDTITADIKPATEIAGEAVEYYRPDKDVVFEMGNSAPKVVHEIPGDSPEVQELSTGDPTPDSAGPIEVKDERGVGSEQASEYSFSSTWVI